MQERPTTYTVVCLSAPSEETAVHDAETPRSGYVYEMEFPVLVPRSTVKKDTDTTSR